MVGKPYANLATDLARDQRYARFHLTEAIALPPKAEGGFNIEALTDTQEGTLLIGFRSPIPEGRALLVPLLNPNEVIMGQTPKFGDPLLPDLGGLGFRGVTSTEKGYYILAGPPQGSKHSKLFFSAGGPRRPKWSTTCSFPRSIPKPSACSALGAEDPTS